MARNEEKSQSMLYRFREQKAMEMGMINRTDRRPRLASMCNDLRQCERWRGEILRDVSRKVSKIQDRNLTDYEVRDINDEINKLLREKYHWENQIINLGGANYRRVGQRMYNADGTQVPSTRGYKYFGRARELPGVKELFEEAASEQKQEKELQDQSASIFSNQTPAYYGDQDDSDAALLDAEKAQEAEGWDDQWAGVLSTVDAPDDTPAPSLPTSEWIVLPVPSTSTAESASGPQSTADASDEATGEKRKAATDGEGENAKRSKGAGGDADGSAAQNGHRIHTVLKVGDFTGPPVPSLDDIENAILQRQKAELLQEYL